MRVLALFLALPAAAFGANAHGVGLGGDWRAEFPCEDATGPFAERCQQGARDSFTLHLVVDGKRICGIHMSTAQLGNKVDAIEDGPAPTLSGVMKGDAARVRFQSMWGGTGTAELRRVGATLEWRIVGHDDGDDWLPSVARLVKIPSSAWGSNLNCSLPLVTIHAH
jgi:hypothetical protein